MNARHITISEAARRHGVSRSTIQRKIARGELERVALKNGSVGVTLASLRRVYGDLDTLPHDAAPPLPHAAGNAAPVLHPCGMPHAAPSATELAAEVALLRERLAASEASKDELRNALDHERTDRAAERAVYQTALADMSRQLVAVKGADYARDMAKITEGKSQTINGETAEPEPSEQPQKQSAARGAKTRRDNKPTKPQAERPSAGLWGWLSKLRP